MKYLVLSLVFFSFNALACWNMQATLLANRDKVVINQKIDHDKTYSFANGNHIFHIKIPSKFERPPHLKDSKDAHFIEIGVQEKKGITLSEITMGKILVKTGHEATLTKDYETGEQTTFTVKLTEI